MRNRPVSGSTSFISFITTALLFLALVAGIFGIVRTVSGITTMEYQIGKLEARKAEAFKERKALEAEISAMLSMQHVESRGLPLVIPSREQVIYVRHDAAGVRRASETK